MLYLVLLKSNQTNLIIHDTIINRLNFLFLHYLWRNISLLHSVYLDYHVLIEITLNFHLFYPAFWCHLGSSQFLVPQKYRRTKMIQQLLLFFLPNSLYAAVLSLPVLCAAHRPKIHQHLVSWSIHTYIIVFEKLIITKNWVKVLKFSC